MTLMWMLNLLVKGLLSKDYDVVIGYYCGASPWVVLVSALRFLDASISEACLI